MFFLTVGRPALRLALPSTGTEVMGFIHLFGDRRMPIWGVSAMLSNLLLASFSGNGYRAFYLLSLCMLILFVVIYDRFYCQGIWLKNGHPRFYRHVDGFYSKLLARVEKRELQAALIG
jgi:hypothetical protein